MKPSTDSNTSRNETSASRFKTLFIVVALIGVVGLGALAIWKLLPEETVEGMVGGELVYEVERGDLLISFTERGNVRAASSEPIYCLLEGKSSTIIKVVEDGKHVEKGELLVELDSSGLETDLNEQQIKVDTAEADLAQAREQVKIQESLNRSNIQKGELDVLLAQIDLKKYEEGDWPLSIETAQADIFIAGEELARAETEFEWTKKLADKGYVTLTKLRADELAVEKAKVQEKKAKGSLRVLEEYTRRKDLETYKSALQQATDALERTKREAAAELSKEQASERAKLSAYNLSVQRLEKLQDQLAKTKIFAPASGMVVYENQHGRRGSSERVIEAGADVYENQLLMKLPDVSTMAVEVQVHESWVDRVTPGQVALVSMDARPDLKLRARITKVGVLPDQVNRWLNPDLKVYKTELVIEDDNPDASLLKPGMSAKVQVLIQKVTDALFVPVQSVTTIDRHQVCYVWMGSRFEPQRVVCGGANDSFIEVREGLEEGDLVQLNAPPPEGGDIGDTENLPDVPHIEKKRGERGGRGKGGDVTRGRGGPEGRRGRGEARRPSGGKGPGGGELTEEQRRKIAAYMKKKRAEGGGSSPDSTSAGESPEAGTSESVDTEPEAGAQPVPAAHREDTGKATSAVPSEETSE